MPFPSGTISLLEFGEISKFKRQAKQTGKSNNKYTVNGILVKRNQGTIRHINIRLKTHIAVPLWESTISSMLVCLPAQLAC